MVIDDDPGIQDLLKIIFEKAGYLIAIEPDGNNIVKGNYELPDIFLLDRQLCGIDGLSICSHLKTSSNTGDIPVILISASPDIESLSKTAGADGFIEKPFNMHELLGLVHTHLNKTIQG